MKWSSPFYYYTLRINLPQKEAAEFNPKKGEKTRHNIFREFSIYLPLLFLLLVKLPNYFSYPVGNGLVSGLWNNDLCPSPHGNRFNE